MATIEIDKDMTAALPRFIAQLVLIIFGAALVVAAFLVWLVPTASGLPEVSLIKVGLSASTLIAGLCCIVCTKEGKARG